MASNYMTDEVREKIRRKLNEEKIKLWLPPYTTETGDSGEESKVV